MHSLKIWILGHSRFCTLRCRVALWKQNICTLFKIFPSQGRSGPRYALNAAKPDFSLFCVYNSTPNLVLISAWNSQFFKKVKLHILQIYFMITYYPFAFCLVKFMLLKNRMLKFDMQRLRNTWEHKAVRWGHAVLWT